MKTVLDLFSGIGGFSLAARRAGFEVVAHCEIDQFPKAVLAHRFFNTPIFDDIRTINKRTFYEKTGLKKIDIVVGGSPCQDFSVAGRQRGFDGDRSSLFLEQMRVARELGAEYIVWENVPGVLSSNGGRDFARILSEFTGWTIEPQKFGGVGCVRARGDGDTGVFYRILDSRFFGVPQRRRRIYLVGRLGGLCRPEVLFEPDSLRGHSAAGTAQGKDVTVFANNGIGVYNSSRDAATLRVGGESKGGGSTLVISESSPTARADVPTLTAALSHSYNKQTPLLFENHAHDGRVEQKPHSPTLTSHCGTGGGNLPLVLNSDAVCIAENIIGRQDHNGGNGVGAQQGVSYTLNTVGVHGVSDGFGVRRLTPRECERLQGFPDDWTRIPYRGKPAESCPDGPRYKACGNAVTVNVAQWVMERLARYA